MSSPDSDEADRNSAGRTEKQVGSFEFESQPEAPESPDQGVDGGEESHSADRQPEQPEYADRVEELKTVVDALEAENTRLRTDYARARKSSYRKNALALAAIGALAVLGGIGLPDVRAVLFVTGSIGLFGSAMTWYLTPERVVPIAVSESIYDAAATTLTGVRDELGLQSSTAYVPVGDQVRGFVPRHRDFDSPENAMHVFVTDDDASRGFSFAPAGDRLAGGFERLRETETPDNALTAAEQLAETLVSHFEIADAVTIDADTDVESSRLTVSVQNAAFGPLTRPDHPVVSALACEIVQTTDSSVVVDPINDTTVALETDSALEE